MDSVRDVVAIFVAEFQAVQGNIIDWSHTVDESISLNGVEFNVLPSGIHSVDKDVIYFTKDAYYGVSVYRRIATEEVGMRGARMISIGVLVANTSRPRPWNHISALKKFAVQLEDDMSNKEPMERYFNDRKVADLNSLEEPSWDGWENELNQSTMDHPLLHLPHVLRVLGISTLTLFKHALGRRRVLIYTHTPVEPACLLAQLAAVMCIGEQANTNNPAGRPRVLGLVGLTDLPRIEQETSKGEGWIACTTDAIFLEKPRLFDLLIDLTTSAQNNSRKPSLSVSRAFTNGSGKQEYKLQTVRFTWSDVKIWNELERILDAFATQSPSTGDSTSSKSRWTDPWMIYEDMCLVCAHIWIGGQSSPSIKLDSTAALLESRSSSPGPIVPESDSQAQSSSSSMKKLGPSSEDPRLANTQSAVPSARAKITTLSLVAVLHNHADFLLSRLSEMVPLAEEEEGFVEGDAPPIVLGPKEVVAFGLGPMSELDARFIEWIGERRNRKVKVKRGWKDLAAFVLGLS